MPTPEISFSVHITMLPSFFLKSRASAYCTQNLKSEDQTTNIQFKLICIEKYKKQSTRV
ncbi:hypothetical protein F511_38096 [Dorcoceras hygrometricum]|uniref:Uncharacterized protein n=1 Tax=Dorcoceras hygrometricum TaxID=472368 RepID=A0A2Z7AD41_9LAMI|nr:hypothetical protein F511_38096 [Dorcoceras hygrometricum]